MTEALLTNGNGNHVAAVPVKVEKAREKKVEHFEPPDGGFRAYLVMICAFLCNGILFGIINTYSVIYLSLQRQLNESGDQEASSKAGKKEIYTAEKLWKFQRKLHSIRSRFVRVLFLPRCRCKRERNKEMNACRLHL